MSNYEDVKGDLSNKIAFDVDLEQEIDLTVPPTTGIEYLQRVILESKQSPLTVISDKDFSHFQSRQNYIVDGSSGFTSAPPGFEPEKNWLIEALERFKHVRQHLNEKRDKLLNQHHRKWFPEICNKADWCRFILGAKGFEKVYADTEVTLRNPSCFGEDGVLPLLSILLHLKHSDIEVLLTWHIEWLKITGFTHHQGKWFYALLTVIEVPVLPETCSELRELSRLCSNFRANLGNPSIDILKPLNLIINIVSEYFNQKDMSDNVV